MNTNPAGVARSKFPSKRIPIALKIDPIALLVSAWTVICILVWKMAFLEIFWIPEPLCRVFRDTSSVQRFTKEAKDLTALVYSDYFVPGRLQSFACLASSYISCCVLWWSKKCQNKERIWNFYFHFSKKENTGLVFKEVNVSERHFLYDSFCIWGKGSMIW